jgi:hypothetical protein
MHLKPTLSSSATHDLWRPAVHFSLLIWPAETALIWPCPLIRAFKPAFQFRLFRWTLLTSFWYGLLIWPWGILSIPIQPLETAFKFSISGRPFQMAFGDSLKRRRPFDTTLRRPFKVAFQFSLLRQSSNSVFQVGLSRWPSETVLRDDLLIQPFELHVWI